MVATWTIGEKCVVEDLAEKLSETGFTLVVLVLSTAVAERQDENECVRFLMDVIEKQQEPKERRGPILDRILGEKSIYMVNEAGNQKMFIAVHKAKVTNAAFDSYLIRSRGIAKIKGISFGTLTPDLDTNKQRLGA